MAAALLAFLYLCASALSSADNSKASRSALAEVETEPPCEGCLALVSVWKRVPPAMASSWLFYHLSLGFDRVYIFLDSPDKEEELIKILTGFEPAVRLIASTEEYKAHYWEPCLGVCQDCECRKHPEQFLLPGIGVFAETEFTARHLLYVTRAAALARSANVEWLLHLDSDELFFLPTDGNMGAATRHFAALSENNFTHAQFLNDEVVPVSLEKETKKSFFEEDWFFKKNIMLPSIRESEKQRKWLSYIVGKGAINIPAWKRSMNDVAILPYHVTSFAHAGTGMCAMKMEICREMANDLHYNFDAVNKNLVQVAVEYQSARILHYVITSMDQLVRRLKNRATLPTHIFDPAIVSESMKTKFARSEILWWNKEELPGHGYFKELFDIVAADGRKLGKNAHRWIRDYVLLPKKTSQVEALMDAGIIQLRADAGAAVRGAVSVGAACTKGGGTLGECGRAMARNASQECSQPSETKWKSCPQRGPWEGHQEVAPHYRCDFETAEECCEVLRLPAFNLEKRMLGYRWYDVNELWSKDLQWEDGGIEAWLSQQRDALGVDDATSWDNPEYWTKRMEEDFPGLSGSANEMLLQEVEETLKRQYHWRTVSKAESLRTCYELLKGQGQDNSTDDSEAAAGEQINSLKAMLDSGAAKDEL